MSTQIPTLPINISFTDWATQLIIDLPDSDIPNPPNIKNWRFWASQIVINDNLNNVPSPTELLYKGDEGWRQWAKDFISNLK